MSISSLTNTQAHPGSCLATARSSKPSGISFQDQLVQSAAGAAGSPKETAQTNPTKQELLSTLFSLKLDWMKLSKEKKEEVDDWQELEEYLDAWIESLREGSADIEKAARAYAAIEARRAENPVKRKTPEDYILEQLAQRLSL